MKWLGKANEQMNLDLARKSKCGEYIKIPVIILDCKKSIDYQIVIDLFTVFYTKN